jgi:cytidylate kinase
MRKQKNKKIRNQKPYKIAIDGPAGAGKSTIAKLIAKKMKFLYIDSGAMYRAATLFLIEKDLLKANEKKINSAIKNIKIDFKEKGGKQLVFLNNKDVSKEIRSGLINKNVSHVSSLKCVRELLVRRQKDFGLKNSIIMDGRDIGTTVFKDADLKIYLTATSEERARRRKKDLEKLNEKVSVSNLVKDIQRRDNIDSSRKISPLSKASDAILIDSSNLNINEVIESIEFFIPN